MLRREFIRIIILASIGLIGGVFMALSDDLSKWYMAVLGPVYVVGMVYAGRVLLSLLGGLLKTYFSGQFMSLIFNPLWGTLICIAVLVIGVMLIFSFGWILGLGKCVYTLFNCYQIDRECEIQG